MQIDVGETPCVGRQGPARQPAAIVVVADVFVKIEGRKVSESDRAAVEQIIIVATQQAPYEYKMKFVRGLNVTVGLG